MSSSLRDFASSSSQVDIIRNDWSKATQRLVARVEMNGALLVTRSNDDRRWTEILLGSERMSETGPVAPSAGKDYLAVLVRDYEHDSYFDATPMHPLGEDSLPDGVSEIPMRRVDPPTAL